jgi:hypothetical protein
MSLTQAAALQNISQNKGATNIWGYTMIGLLGSFALAGGYAYVTKSTNQNKQNTQVTQVTQGGKRHTRKRRSFREKATK